MKPKPHSASGIKIATTGVSAEFGHHLVYNILPYATGILLAQWSTQIAGYNVAAIGGLGIRFSKDDICNQLHSRH
jgi:hypothetical protein